MIAHQITGLSVAIGAGLMKGVLCEVFCGFFHQGWIEDFFVSLLLRRAFGYRRRDTLSSSPLIQLTKVKCSNTVAWKRDGADFLCDMLLLSMVYGRWKRSARVARILG